jgi:very-short-patch-repair endonuclease
MLDQRALVEPAPGVLVIAGSEATWRQQLTVASLCCREAGAVGFEAAAALHGTDGYREGARAVLLPAPRRFPIVGVETHVGPFDHIDLTVVDGIRCTTVERTLCDLGSVSPDHSVRMAFEWYWRSFNDLAPLQAAVDRLHRPGQHGTKAMQELLVDARLKGVPTESALEVRLEAIIGDLDGLARQYNVFDDAGAFVARVDFAIPELRIAFEAHSKQFHDGAEAHRRDSQRHERLVTHRWKVRYITSAEMDNPAKLRTSVRRVLDGREHPVLPALTTFTTLPGTPARPPRPGDS